MRLHRDGSSNNDDGRGSNEKRSGVVIAWARGLGLEAAAELVRELAHIDASLTLAMPGVFGDQARVERIGLMVLERCAADLGMNAGELALLLDDGELELMRAMLELTTAEERAGLLR